MSDRLEVRIITPARVVYSHKADSILLPGAVGEMEILPGHCALFSTIKPGQLVIRDGDKKEQFACGAGFVEVSLGRVCLLVDVASGMSEIDPAAAQAFIAEAEDKLKNLSNEDVEQRYAFETQLATAKARIELYEHGTKDADFEASKGFSIAAVPAVEKKDAPEK